MPVSSELLDAIQKQQIDTVRELVKSEENLPKSIQDFGYVPVFDILLRAKAFDIINLFINKGIIETDIYEYDDLEKSLFFSMLKVLGNDAEALNFVAELMPKLSNVNDAVSNKTLLGLAFEQKANPDIVKVLIDGGCDVNTVNNAENTYLHQIANNYINDADLVIAYTQLLIDYGADVNAGNIVAETPLMHALGRNKKEMVQLLLENGASANDQNKEGKTPYYIATVNIISYPFYELLKKFDQPDFDKRTNDGVAFFFELLKRTNNSSQNINDLIKAMLQDGASMFQTSLHYGTEKTPFDILAEKPADLFELVLKESGIDVTHADSDGNTLLHKVAAFNVNYDQNAARDTYKKTKLLLDLGANATITNNRDETALMLASTDNLKSKTVELLLQQTK